MKIANSLFSSLFIVGLLALSSCVQESNRSTTPKEVDPVPVKPIETIDPVEPVDTIPVTPPTVDVAVYTEYPEAIDGCACYFGKTASELSEGKYIFMSNYEKKAYMMLDGQMRVFDLISSTDLEGGRLMENWSNENYEMVVKSTETGSVDETWQSIGTINIKPTDKAATMISVVGECGC
jgi:hypothetical protein